VADEPELPVDEATQESLSLAERLASAYYDWLHDEQRHRGKRFEPVEMVLFAVIAGVTLIIAAELLTGFASALNLGAWALVGITTQWAQLPFAVVLLGASLLGWYQGTRCCDEFERYLDQGESDQDETDDIDQAVTSLLGRVSRSRLALVCLAVLGFVTSVAAVANVVWDFQANLNFGSRAPWYGKVAYVAEGLAIVIPALVCLMIAKRAWTRTSYLLLADETDAVYEDETEQPAEPESVS
jgi:hypothetical protein